MSHLSNLLRNTLCAVAIASALSACHHSADKEKSDIAGIIPSASDDSPIEATEARYTQWPDPADTMLIYIDGMRYKVSSNGNIFAPDGTRRYRIGNSGSLDVLFFVQKGVSLILFYTDVTSEGAANYAERIDIQTGKVLWTTSITGVSMNRPVVKGQFAYIASSGFVGKLKLKNGQYDWKYSGLNSNGRFEKFRDVSFPSNREVIFMAPHTLSLECDTLVINDMTGEIIRMN